MAYLTPQQVAQYAQKAGFTGQGLVSAVAIAGGESTFNSDAVNSSAADATWGPSIGLWQIRALRAQYGTGGPRDQLKLSDPLANAQAAFQISGGKNFSAWQAYTAGSYKQFVPIAQSAAGAIGAIKYQTEQVDINGKPYRALVVPENGTDVAYLPWTVLEASAVNYVSLGNGVITIAGASVQGLVYQGTTYIPYYVIPTIKVHRVAGTLSFTTAAGTALALLLLGAVVSAL